MKRRFYIFLSVILGTAIFLCIIASPWIWQLNQRIVESLKSKELAEPTRFFAGIGRIKVGQKKPLTEISTHLKRLGYRLRAEKFPLRQGDYKLPSNCPTNIDPSEPIALGLSQQPEVVKTECIEFTSRSTEFGPGQKVSILWMDQRITRILVDSNTTDFVYLESLEFAQFLGGAPVLRDLAKLGKIPTDCLNAVLAIEDPDFLKHQGISITGIIRMVYVNVLKGGFRQGGSTITQQVVRNSWLTLEKTIKRKLTEMVMAILLEFHTPKDTILEMYLNIIYMGQNGPYQVRGFKSAADYYFNTDLEQLNLPQCALLAAVLNSPGLFNPFTKPENARKRRTRVLTKMLKNKFISLNEFDKADLFELPDKKKESLIPPTLWFVESVKTQMAAQKIDLKGAKVLTTMDLDAQIDAYHAVKKQLPALDKKVFAKNKKLKHRPKSKALQTALLSADVETGEIYALIGGRNYRRAPFNRALSAHRQIGSNMKPLVYLTALESLDEDGQNYTPLHPILDEKFTHHFGRNNRQQWSPKNYGDVTFGKVPLYWALKNSLNISTAKLGIKIGLESLIDVSRRLGVRSKLKAMPALTLGSFEMYPIEVLKLYLTIANFGKSSDPFLVQKVIDAGGQEIFKHDFQSKTVVDPNTIAVLIGMMKQTLKTGTGKSISTWRGFTHPAAGKTGTTSDERDAWFSGFTPHLATVVWVGYDDNTSHKLTGASGAIPIWAEYMKKISSRYTKDEFAWPDGVRIEKVNIPNLEPKPVEIILRKFSETISW